MDTSSLIEKSKSFWENAYSQNINKMIGVGFRYTSDRQIAEDLAHDAFMIAIQKISTFEGKGPFEAWLRRIVVNVCMQYFREQSKKKYIDDWIINNACQVDTQEENQNSENPYFTENELFEAINKLPEHHKLVFNLFVIDKFSHHQIAQELNISEGTSKSHLARARKKLKELLNNNSTNQKKRKTAFLLLFWNIDDLYIKRFQKFEIPPQTKIPIESFIGQNPQNAVLRTHKLISKVYWNQLIALSSLTLVGALTLLFIQKTSKYSEKAISENQIMVENIIRPSKIISNSTATISKKNIMIDENKFVIKNEDSMKNLKTFGSILVATSSLALSTNGQDFVKIESKASPKVEVKANASGNVNMYLQANVDESVNINTKMNINSNIDLSGTFYGEKLIWSAENNNLYFEGKSVVKFGKNSFVSSGSSSFLDKVYYLVIDGKPAKLGSVTPLSEKKYNLHQLSSKTAAKKYGDSGKNGAIEIFLAE